MKLILSCALIMASILSSTGCDYEVFEGGFTLGDPRPANADFGTFYIIEGGKEIQWSQEMTTSSSSLEIRWSQHGDSGKLSVRVVSGECGEVNSCGPDYPDCPGVAWIHDGGEGNLTRSGAMISGLCPGRRYQFRFQYKVSDGGITTCRWLQTAADMDPSGCVEGIIVEPLGS